MRLNLIITAALFLTAFYSFSQGTQKNEYRYTIDLTRVVNDRVFIQLTAPKITSTETIFYLPKMIPGTYRIADYGRFVNDFKAFDSKGNSLPVVKLNENAWKISQAQKLATITYWADDITDSDDSVVYRMAATHIEEGKNFVINTSGFFGYFEGKKDISVSFNVIRPKDFYGATGLVAQQTDQPVTKITKEADPEGSNKRVDSFVTENYDRLIDSPLMYSKPDTAIINVANAEVLISSYSPNGKINAKEIAATIREVLAAQSKYLGGKLPVNKYAFLFYFTPQPVPLSGALEHSYSSFYYLQEQTITEMNQTLRDFAAHEFFHIVTPLTIHSEEIHKFDFNQPKMSKHLWLYEGITEYFADNVQVKYGLINREEYLEVIRQKMLGADSFKDDVPFTEISKFILDKYPDQFLNVYLKGALIGMCLDIHLRKLSNGKYGMPNLTADLTKKFGKDKGFQDDVLFSEIEKLTYPEIGDFFKRYVAGSEPLPLRETLKLVGINYSPAEPTMVFSLGFKENALTKQDFEGKQRFFVVNTDNLNEQGKSLNFQNGDVLVKINSEDIPENVSNPAGNSTFFGNHARTLKEGEVISYSVLRKDKSGKYHEIELKSPVIKVKGFNKHVISFMSNPTAEQLAIQRSWLTAN